MKTLFRKLKNQKGFTMVESILTSTILAVALIGGMTIMQNATSNTVNTDLSTVATQLANEKVEEIIADKAFKGYDYLTTANYTESSVENSTTTSQTTLYNMNRTVTISEVNADDLSTPEEGSGVKRIVVAVSWGSEQYQNIQVSTLISDYE